MKRLITLTENSTNEMIYIPIEKITRIVCVDINGRKLTEVHTGGRTPAIVIEPAILIAEAIEDAFDDNFKYDIRILKSGS